MARAAGSCWARRGPCFPCAEIWPAIACCAGEVESIRLPQRLRRAAPIETLSATAVGEQEGE
ncbi:hypothetical protein ACP4OV_026629 [Aristida adscensionis]